MHAWVVVAVGCGVGVAASAWWLPAPAVAATVGALAAALAIARPGPPPSALLGLALGWLLVGTQAPGPVVRGWVTLEGVVAGATSGSEADVAVARLARPGTRWEPSTGRVRVRFLDRPPPPGTPVLVTGRAGPMDRGVLPGAPDPVVAARRGRVATRLVAHSAAIVGGDRSGHPVLGDRTGLLRALALGDRSRVDPEALARLRRTGTAHLLAISGLHVGAVAGAITGAGLLLLRAVAVLRPVGIPQGAAWLFGAAAAGVWAWSVGAPVSAQRAAVLVALVATARATGRTAPALPTLALAALAVLFADPSAIGTASFQLSFGAVAGLIRWRAKLARPARRWWWPVRAVWGGLATTVAAMLGTLPAAAWWFQEVAPLAPVANLVAIPVVTFVVAPAAAVATWGPPSLALPAGALGSTAVESLDAILAFLAVPPLTPAVGPAGAALLAALLLVPRRPWRLLPAVALVLGLRAQPVAPQVTFLDVGQGDAALIEHADGRRWLIDGGPPGLSVLRWLRRRGVRHLHLVVATHCQADHIGGLDPVLRALSVDEVWASDPEPCADLLALAADQGARIRLRPPDALHPDPGFKADDPNDRSLVLHAAGVLFTGDVEALGESRLQPPPALALKVPHHGSRSSSSEALLAQVRPAIAVVSAGRRNLFGHPHPRVIARYAAAGIDVYRTDLHGTVVMRPVPGGVQVRSKRSGRAWTSWRFHPSPWAAFPLLRPSPPGPGEPDGHQGDEHRHTLGVAEPGAEHLGEEVPAGGVAPERLDHPAAEGVEQQVQCCDLSREPPARVAQVHHEADDQEPRGLIQLGGMERDVQRGRGAGLGEPDRPRHVGGQPMAAAGREAAHPGERVPQRHRRGEDVPGGEEREPEPPHHEARYRQAGEQGAVEHEAPRADVHPGPRIHRHFGVLQHEQHPRADQAGDGRDEHQVGHPLGHQPDGPAPHQPDARHQEEGHSAEHAVGVQWEVADGEQYGVHQAASSSTSSSSSSRSRTKSTMNSPMPATMAASDRLKLGSSAAPNRPTNHERAGSRSTCSRMKSVT